MDYTLERKMDKQLGAYYVIRKRFSKDVIMQSSYFAKDSMGLFEKEIEEIKFLMNGWKRFIKEELKDGSCIVFEGSPIVEFIQKKIINSIFNFKKKGSRILVLFPGHDGKILLDQKQQKSKSYGWSFHKKGFRIKGIGIMGSKIANNIEELISIVNENSRNGRMVTIEKIHNNPSKTKDIKE